MPETRQVVRADSRGTVRAPPPRTSRRRAPASRRVDGGSRTARTRSRPDRAYGGWRYVGPSMACPPLRLPRAGRSARRRRQYEAQPDGSERPIRPPDDGPGRPRPALPAGPWRPVGGHRRPRAGTPGRGLVHDFIHQVIHTNGRSVNARAERACRPVRGRTSHATRRVSPRPGRVGRIQRWSAPSSRPVERVVGEQQAAVEIDPVGQRRDGRRAGDPDRRLLHAAEERPEAELAGRSSIAFAGPIPPHLASLTLTPATTPTSASRSSVVTALSSATIGSDERSWSQREVPIGAGRERLLDELDAEVDRARAAGARRRPGSSRCWRRPGSVRRTPRGRLAASRGRRGPPHLILSAGKSAARRGPLGDDGRLVDADREVGRRDRRRTGRAARGPGRRGTLPDEIVERDVDGALGGAVPADRRRHRVAAAAARPAA